ncbi:LuxR C-terminal-related transcriptional regulator [Halodesulfovibrio sp. MK-HDV]|jgi:LuxR family transcriptional regulator, quorum-sensing system regulator SdiA|uniref:LuxR C-terminal-related transcriptional regulator n=1 Tax=Halodesulfovibrio sp. MK-HDV TaxID=2599925 RepID=UPI00136FDDD0|nr:LuxR C-terminal-related transcriptional regulator [Halodesulfovibrio sp. MK-HDV]KAF1076716.1 Transcriptional activator protein LuxR [Halodesulfovibrio sp. MK-HDV]
MNDKLYEILETIVTSDSHDYLWEKFVEYAKHMGVAQLHTWFKNTNSNISWFSTVPEWWHRNYIETNAIEYDSIINHTLTGNGPLLYGCDQDIGNPLLCEKAQKLIQISTSEFNYSSGITMPSFYNNKRIGGINVCFPETVSQLNDVPTDRILELLLVSSTAHERLYVLTSKNTHAISLTPRQQECLTWLAGGLTSHEVADKIGISHHTVKMHIDSAKERLGATTRIQAVAKALTAGLISIP